MAEPRPGRWLAAVAAVAASVVVAGCAASPAGNQPRKVGTGGSQIQAYVQPLPPPGPKQNWKPSQVVLGFLHASASYAFDPSAALRYLAPALRKAWKPQLVTVVSSVGGAAQLPDPPQLARPAPAAKQELVNLTGQRLATLSQSGQYQYSPGNSSYQFTLTQINGVWLISALPEGQQTLLLTQSDFEHVYQPRNLFFFDDQSGSPVNGELVPDPVYAPLQNADSALNTNLAAGLVEGLLSDRGSWLSGATQTSFPAGTKLLGITITGQTAVVNLNRAAARANSLARVQMLEQLQATLESKAYSPALAHNVDLVINGKQVFNGVSPPPIYPVESGRLVYQGTAGTADEIGHRASLLPAGGPDSGAITALAASLPAGSPPSAAPQVAVAEQDGGGCTVYLPGAGSQGHAGGQYRSFRLSDSGGPCTSLSWNADGYVWAAASQHIWRLAAQTGQVLQVGLPVNAQIGGKSGNSLLAVQMAPDGVRVALLLKEKGGNRLLLAAVTSGHAAVSLGTAVAVGTGLPEPVAIGWYSAYELVALTGTAIWEVPLTGGPGSVLGPAPAGAVSLATDGKALAVGTSRGEILSSSTGGSSWSKIADGTIPSYSS